MAWQVFGTLTAGNQNLSLFDTLTAQIAKQVIISCTMTGTNAITLAGTTNAPTIAAYSDYVQFSGFPANTTSGVVTARFGSLAFLKVYLNDGSTQASTNDITANYPIGLMYLSTLDTGNGGFYLLKSAVLAATTVQVSLAQFRGLIAFNNAGTPSTKIDITASQAIMTTTAGATILRSSVSVTCDLTTTGANGMDTGSRPTSGWVYVYLIDNGSAPASLASATSPTAGVPTLPGGYTYSGYVGAMYCDGSQNLLRTRQEGRRSEYQPTAATNTLIIPTIDNGVKGTYSDTSPTLTAVTVTGNSGFVPLTAGSIIVVANAKWKAGTLSNIIVAPIVGYGGTNNGPEGSGGQSYPIFIHAQELGAVAELLLATTTIAWASSQAGAAISCQGWTDYYSRS